MSETLAGTCNAKHPDGVHTCQYRPHASGIAHWNARTGAFLSGPVHCPLCAAEGKPAVPAKPCEHLAPGVEPLGYDPLCHAPHPTFTLKACEEPTGHAGNHRAGDLFWPADEGDYGIVKALLTRADLPFRDTMSGLPRRHFIEQDRVVFRFSPAGELDEIYVLRKDQVR